MVILRRLSTGLSQPSLASRRAFLRAGTLALLGVALSPRAARAALEGGRRLRMLNTHTGEKLDLVYAEGGVHLPEALAALARFLRDHRTGDVHPISPATLDLAWAVAQAVEKPDGRFEIISGYRSPDTNERLRGNGGSGVARHSLHLEGRALDLRLDGVETRRLRAAALALARGGVGFYPASDFVHLDDGRVRTW